MAFLAYYTTADEFFSRHFDFDEELTSFYNKKSALEKLGIEVDRKSLDNKRNNNGFQLLEICKNNNLSILNRRFGADRNIGNYTFRGAFVLYLLAIYHFLSILHLGTTADRHTASRLTYNMSIDIQYVN